MALSVHEWFGEFVESTLPILRWLPRYDRSWLRADVVAGITVAAALVPEALAYASLANLPPETGLYAGLVAVTVYLFFGTSRQVILGPTSALAILLASSVGDVAATTTAGYTSLVATTTILVGFLALLARAFRLGFLVNFVSGSVLTGFSAGAALYIVSTQLGTLLGIDGGSGNFFQRIWYVAARLGEVNTPTLAVGVAAVAVLLVGRFLLPHVPSALVVVLSSIVLMAVTPLERIGVSVVGPIPAGVPSISVPAAPSVSTVLALVPVSVALFLLSYVEGMSVAETFARRHGDRVDANQELLADGVANLAAGLVSGFVVGGSLTRSALNDSVGVRSQLGNAVVAVVLLLVLLFLTTVFAGVPEVVLSAVIVVAVLGLVDIDAFRRLARISKSELVVAVGSLVGVLVFGLLWGVFVGVGLSLLVTIGRVSDPRVEELGRVPGTDHFVDQKRHEEVRDVPGVLVYRVEAQLFYANASVVHDTLLARVDECARPVDLVVLDLVSSPTVDLEAVEMLEDLHATLVARDVDFRVAGADPQVCRLLVRSGFDEIVGTIREEEAISAVIRRWEDEQSQG